LVGVFPSETLRSLRLPTRNERSHGQISKVFPPLFPGLSDAVLYRVPTIDLASYSIAREVLALVPEVECRRRTVVPVSIAGRSLILAVADPGAAETLAFVSELTGRPVEVVRASADDILAALDRAHRSN